MMTAARLNPLERFLSLQSELHALMNGFIEEYKLPSFVGERVSRLVDYCVAGGKMNRGMFVLQIGTMLLETNHQESTECTEQSYDRMVKYLSVAGWCIELMQAFFLVADDVMDQSPMRRGKPAWYRCPDIGLQAVNDAVLLESLMFRVLSHYFHPANPDSPVTKEGWIQLETLFRETIFKTELGQVLDLTLTQQIQRMEDYKLDSYLQMVTYKTAFYSFVLPAQVAYGIATDCWSIPQPFMDALLKLGCLFQVQDDFLDCYGDPKEMGKVGTDIQDGKYSFLVISAVQQILAIPDGQESAALMHELNVNYATHDEQCIQRVKKIFDKLNLTAIYESFVIRYESELHHFIKSSSDATEGRVIEKILAKISKRSK